jgi:hypothetical protein
MSRWRYGCDVPSEQSTSGRGEELTGGRARVQSVPYKGPLPDLPSQPDQHRRVLDAAEVQAMLTPRARAQQPLVEAADRIQVLVREREYGGFGVLALEDDPPSVVLFWKGPLPRPVQHLVDELRSTVRVEVRDAIYSRDELRDEARRIIPADRSNIGVKIWGVGPLNDCSGLSVVIDRSTDLARAKREVTSHMKLEFSFGGPIIAL